MATAAQFRANQENAQKSTGATSAAGKQASSQNRTSHGLCAQSTHSNSSFYFLEGESIEKYEALWDRLTDEHQPQTETEEILVRRMVQHDWLRARALRLQDACLFVDQPVQATTQFALYLRYQVTHERAFYKALNELQKLRNEREKSQIGFESQKRAQAAEIRAERALHLREQDFQIKKLRFERTQQPVPSSESSPVGQKMAA